MQAPRVLYWTAGLTGSGHVVQAVTIANAFRRLGLAPDYRVLAPASPFNQLLTQSGIAWEALEPEEWDALRPGAYRSSRLWRALQAARPELIIVDLFWFAIQGMLDELAIPAIFLCRQLSPAGFRLDLAGEDLRFDPPLWRHALATEPFEHPVPLKHIDPLVILEPAELLSREAALARLGAKPGRPLCLLALNGRPGEFEAALKTYAYLEDEGWQLIGCSSRNSAPFPIAACFAAVELLICGAGYNQHWEARYFNKETVFLPQPRRNEDQALRVALGADYRFEGNGANQLAALIAAELGL